VCGCCPRLEEAIQVFNKSLTEHRNADTLAKLNAAEKALKDKREAEYINMDKSNEEKVCIGAHTRRHTNAHTDTNQCAHQCAVSDHMAVREGLSCAAE
jgi:hypothetical protein